MLFSLSVGKIDAGVAVLLTEDKRLIEFPSILLPADISSGSIVDITVSRNVEAEKAAEEKFNQLQDQIFKIFASTTPSIPALKCRNATQTSAVLEWDPISIGTAELKSLYLNRNGSKSHRIPKPRDTTCTKVSGLAVDTEYTFNLVLKTSAGVYTSEDLTVRTHKMTQLSGIRVTCGIMPGQIKDSLVTSINKIGGVVLDTVRIDTTHFVCTEGRGQAWEKATEMNIPIVVPDWVKGCEREGRLVGVRSYYLNADPRLRQIGGVTMNEQIPVDTNNQLNIIGSKGTHKTGKETKLEGNDDSSPVTNNQTSSDDETVTTSPTKSDDVKVEAGSATSKPGETSRSGLPTSDSKAKIPNPATTRQTALREKSNETSDDGTGEDGIDEPTKPEAEVTGERSPSGVPGSASQTRLPGSSVSGVRKSVAPIPLDEDSGDISELSPREVASTSSPNSLSSDHQETSSSQYPGLSFNDDIDTFDDVSL